MARLLHYIIGKVFHQINGQFTLKVELGVEELHFQKLLKIVIRDHLLIQEAVKIILRLQAIKEYYQEIPAKIHIFIITMLFGLDIVMELVIKDIEKIQSLIIIFNFGLEDKKMLNFYLNMHIMYSVLTLPKKLSLLGLLLVLQQHFIGLIHLQVNLIHKLLLFMVFQILVFSQMLLTTQLDNIVIESLFKIS